MSMTILADRLVEITRRELGFETNSDEEFIQALVKERLIVTSYLQEITKALKTYFLAKTGDPESPISYTEAAVALLLIHQRAGTIPILQFSSKQDLTPIIKAYTPETRMMALELD